jgi:hypothetical protein
MPRKPEGDVPLTTAERSARYRALQSGERAEQRSRLMDALRRIQAAPTVRQAREIATEAQLFGVAPKKL